MVEHYFQEPLSDTQKQRIEAALSIPLKTTPSAYQMYGDKGFTPAEVSCLSSRILHYIRLLISFLLLSFPSWSSCARSMMISTNS